VTIETALETHLKASAALTALVNKRVYYAQAPQGEAVPRVVFHKISDPPIHDVPVRRPRFQFNCIGKTAVKAREIAGVIYDLLQRYKGVMGGAGGVKVAQGVQLNDLDLYDRATDLFFVPVDVMIVYREDEA